MSADVAASVRARLLNKARTNREEFERTLSRFAAERWLFRLGRSAIRERYILKGAALLTVWLPNPHRATRDLDFLAFGSRDDDVIRAMLETVAEVPCPEDGLVFDLRDLSLSPIRPEDEYVGVRALFRARLGTANIRMQVDMGFGDAIPTGPEEVDYPTILESLPAPHVRAYPREQSIAEKFEAMVKLGRRNGRMKDFHDVWSLANAFAFDGERLRIAVASCFARRQSPWTSERAPVLTTAFYDEPDLSARWRAYARGRDIAGTLPEDFSEVGAQLMSFLGPLRDNITDGLPFDATWPAGGPWTPQASQHGS